MDEGKNNEGRKEGRLTTDPIPKVLSGIFWPLHLAIYTNPSEILQLALTLLLLILPYLVERLLTNTKFPVRETILEPKEGDTKSPIPVLPALNLSAITRHSCTQPQNKLGYGWAVY